MANVTFENVSRVFPNGTVAVDRLSLEVRDQELLVLVGPSGCGKTTSLRLVAGLEEADEGTIRIGGRIVNDVLPKNRDVAMVFQNYALYPHMSVYQNLAFGLELRHGPGYLRRIAGWAWGGKLGHDVSERRSVIDQRVRRVAEMLDLGALLDRRPAQLSGGQRQRVALGRALAREPAVYLLDEPLSNLDARLRVEMRREIRTLQQRLATTMIYVTHDQIEAMTLGDRIALMHQGRLQQLGAPLELYDRPQNRFVAGFLGTPPMNFVSGMLARDGDALVFQAPGLRVPVDSRAHQALQHVIGQQLVLGVRPESIRMDGGRGSEHGVEFSETRGRVTAVEALGDATVVHLSVLAQPEGSAASTTTLVAKQEARLSVAPGDVMRFGFEARGLHWFHPTTGESLRW